MMRRGERGLLSAPRRLFSELRSDEGGAVAVLLALLLAVLIGVAALVVDLGQIIIVRSELQNGADAGALAGVVDLVYNGPDTAETTAVTYSTQSKNYQLTNPNPAADAVVVTAVGPETLRVLVRRTGGTSGGAVNTVFAPIWGIYNAGVEAVAVATLERKIIGSGPGNLMPFGIHEDLVDSDGDGNYDVGNIVDIYPHDLSAGNFGLLDLNGGSNSNTETESWIENGYDQTFVIPEATGYVYIEGDPGISGGSLNGAINSRLGDRLLFPVFDEVTEQGANTDFRVVDLVGGTIWSFKLTGASSQRYINVEVDDFSASNVIVGSPSAPENNTVSFPILIQ
jgi:hypothetical protein